MKDIHFFTSINVNYLPKARVLAKSLKEYHPSCPFHLMLIDDAPQKYLTDSEPFDSIILPRELEINNLDSWMFKHSVVELCTAVKGAAFLHLIRNRKAGKVVYLDPDIAVLSSLDDLSRLLDEFSILLTPHQVEPEKTQDAIVDNEICSMKHGVYNLGFLGVRADEHAMKFLTWWNNRLIEYCYDDIANGLFTDQKWVDLAPGFFEGVHILRDKTYNVATWNLTHRPVEKDESGRLCVEKRPIKFYHFSGFDSGAQLAMLRKYAPGDSPLFALREWYIRRMEEEGQGVMRHAKCTYQFFSNGEPITKEARLVYRLSSDLSRLYPHPQAVAAGDCYWTWFRDVWKKTHPDVEVPEKGQVSHLIYEETIDALQREIRRIRSTPAFRIGRVFTWPIRMASEAVRKVRHWFMRMDAH